MKRLKFFSRLWLLCLMLIPIVLSGTPEEKDFILLGQMERGGLNLDRTNGTYGEAYIKYFSRNLQNALVVRLGHNSSEEVDLYVFREVSDIKRDNETFWGYAQKYELKNVFETLVSVSKSGQEGMLYFIFKLRNAGELYKGSVVIFNELDEISLLPGRLFHIKQFYSHDYINFGFDFTKESNPEYEVLVVNHNTSNPTPKVSLFKYEGTTTREIVNQTTDSFYYAISDSAKYKLQVTVQNHMGLTHDLSVLVSKRFSETQQKLSQEMVMGERYSTIGYTTQYFNFYIKLDNFTASEENAVTVSTTRQVFGYSVEAVYASIIENDKGTVFDPSQYFPITSGFKSQIEPNNPKIAHLYYSKNTIFPTKDYYLMISFKYQPVGTDPPVRFDVASSNKIEVVNITDLSPGEYIYYINRTEGVPVVKTFIIDVNIMTNYIFFFPNADTSRIYDGNFLENEQINPRSFSQNLYKFAKEDVSFLITNVSVNFFGEGIGQFMKVIKLTYPVQFSAKREEQSFFSEHIDPSFPFYFITSGKDTTVTHAHVQEYFGQCSVYYKSEITSQREKFFPDSEKYLVDAQKFEIKGLYDIIKIECRYPGEFNIHFIGKKNLVLDMPNSKRWVTIEANKETCIDVQYRFDSSIKIGVYTSFTSPITLYRKESSGATAWSQSIYNGKAYFDKEKLDSGDKLCFKQSNLNGVASVSVITKTEHFLIESNQTKIDKKFLIYYFPQNTEYSEVRLSLRDINTNFYYAFIKQRCENPSECAQYSPFPSCSFEIGKREPLATFSSEETFTFINPYDKKGSSNEFRYYLAIEFINPTEYFSKFDVIYVQLDRPNYPVIAENTLIYLNKGPSNFSDILEHAELKQIDDYRSRYVVVAHKTSKLAHPSLTQKVFHTPFKTYYLHQLYEVAYYSNLGVDTQLTGPYDFFEKTDYNCIALSYKILKHGETFNDTAIYKYNSMKLETNYTHNGTILQWTTLPNVINYTIYIAKRSVISETLMDNDCYLNEMYHLYNQNKTLPEGFAMIKTTTENSTYFDAAVEVFYVVVTAFVHDELDFKVVYPMVKIKDFDPVFPEELFNKTEPFQKNYMLLRFLSSASFYSIMTSNATLDTVFFFDDAGGIDVTMYIFDDLFAVEMNGTELAGYIKKVNLGGVTEVVLPGNKTDKAEAKRYYVIFIGNTIIDFDATWYYFNEQDSIPLDDNDAFYFDNFYSTRTLYFTFNSFSNETTEFILKSEQKYISQNVEIFKREFSSSWRSLYNTNETSINYMIQRHDYGEFRVKVQSFDPVESKGVYRIISIRQKSWEVYPLKGDELYKDILIDSRKLYFKVKMDDWNLNEENMITIYQNPDFENTISYWGKIVVCRDYDTEILRKMPQSESDNEIHIVNSTYMTGYRHILFKNKQMSKSSDESEFLLLTVNFEAEKDFFEPRNLTVALSERLEVHHLSNWPFEQQHMDDTTLKDGIPKITKYVLDNNDRSSYIMYVNKTQASIFFLNGIVDDNLYPGYDYKITNFFSFSNLEQTYLDPINCFYVVYFAEKSYFHTATVRTKSQTRVISQEKRTMRDIVVDIDNCENPYLMIGTYKLHSITAFAYIEQVYGTFNYFYKGEINLELNRTHSILPSAEDEKGLFFYLGGFLDVFQIKCTYPGRVIIHMTDDREEIDPDERNYFYLKKGPKLEKNLRYGHGFDVEIYNHLGASISGELVNRSYQINATSPRATFDIPVVYYGSKVSFLSDQDTVVVINFIDTPNIYRVLEESADITQKYFLVFLPNNKDDYSELKISIEGFKTKMYYLFGRCNSHTEPQYIPKADLGNDPVEEYVFISNFEVEIPNPNIQHNSTSFSHFAAFHFTDSDTVNYRIKIEFVKRKTYYLLDTEQIAYLTNKEEGIFHQWVEIEPKINDYYTMFTKKCGIKDHYMLLGHYNKYYAMFDVNKNYSGFYFKNIGVNAHISGTFSYEMDNYTGIEFSYTRSAEPKLDLITEVERYNEKEKFYSYLNKEKLLVTWDDKFMEKVIDYTLYAIDRTHDLDLVENDCYLYAMEQEYKKTGELPSGFYAIKTIKKNEKKEYKIDFNKNSYIVVVASMSFGVHMRINYVTLKADIKNEPIPEERFRRVLAYKGIPMSLTEKHPEYYVKFITRSMQTDNVFRISEGSYKEELDIKVFFYDSTTSVKVNEETREFTNYLQKCDISKELNECILKGNPSKTGRDLPLYIIIRNYKKTPYESKVLAFNEEDIYSLESYETLLVPQFYSKQKLYFSFSSSKGDVSILSVRNQFDYNTHTITLFESLDGKYVVLKNVTLSNFEHKFKEDDSGYFMLQISSSMQPYQPCKKIVSLEKTQGELIDILTASPFKYAQSKTGKLHFKYDVSDYLLNEENVISVMIPSVYTQSPYFKGLWTKIVPSKVDDPDYEKELVKKAPNSEAESVFQVVPLIFHENYYHVHFIKDMSTPSYEKLFLLITISFELPDNFFDPQPFTLVIGKRQETRIIRKEQSDIEEKDKIQVSEYIPETITFYIPSNIEDDSSFALWFSEQGIATTFKGGMTIKGQESNKYLINPSNTFFQTFAVTNNLQFAKKKTPKVTVKLFGYACNLMIKRVLAENTDILDISGERFDETYNLTINSMKTLTLLGNYLTPTNSWMEREILYGKFEFYYKGDFGSLGEDEYILPKYSDIVNTDFIKLGSTYDALTIKALVPGKILMHIFDNVYDANPNGRSKVRLENGYETEIHLPNGTNVKIEADVKGYGITVNFQYGDQSYNITRYYPLQVSLGRVPEGSTAKLKSNSDCVLTINTIVDDNLYEELDVTRSYVSKTFKHVALRLSRDRNVSDSTIKFTNLNHSLTWGILSYRNKTEYVPLAEKSGFHRNIVQPEKGVVELSFSNLQGKYLPSSLDYIMIVTIDELSTNGIQPYDIVATYTLKQNYTLASEDEINILSFNGATYAHERLQLNTMYDIDGQYMIVARECGSEYQALSFYNYKELLDEVDITTDHHYMLLSNYRMEVQVQSNITKSNNTFDGLTFTYLTSSYAQNNELEKLKKKVDFMRNEDMIFKIHFNRHKKIISWDKYPLADKYVVYVLMKNRIKREDAKNDCFLLNAQRIYEKQYSLKEGFLFIKSVDNTILNVTANEINDDEEYYISVVSETLPPLPLRQEHVLFDLPKYSPLIPESSFVALLPMLENVLSFNLFNNEAYFKFNNSNINTDLMIRVKEGLYVENTTIQILVYNDMKKIEKDTNGIFQNGDYVFNLKPGQSDYIIKSSNLTTSKLYVVIVNYNRTRFTSDILMFNEMDTRHLIFGNPFEIYYFLSKQTYTFNFTSVKDSYIDISLSNELSNNTHIISIYKAGSDSPIIESQNNTFTYSFKDETPCSYKIILKSFKEPYASTRKVIQVERRDGELADLFTNIPLIYNLIVTRPIYAKALLDNYTMDELGIVTLYVSQDLKKKAFKNILAKIVVAEDNEKELIKIMPRTESENEFLIEQLPDEQHYHIHFKVNKKPEGNKKVILLVTVDIAEGFPFFIPKQLTLGISGKKESYVLEELKPDVETEYEFYAASHIPKMISFEIYVGSAYSAYIFLSPGEGFCVFYNGTYINDEATKINDDQNDNLLFALPAGNGLELRSQNKKSNAFMMIVDVKLMAPAGTHKIKVVKVLGPVIFKEGVRKENSYQFEISDCTYPAYFIESYDSIVNAWANIQLDFGSARFYFKGDYSSNPRNRILPSVLDEIDYGFAKLNTLYSNFKIECIQPVRGQIHIFDEIYESPLNKNSRYRFFSLTSPQEYTLPSERPLFLSAYTPYSVDIHVSLDPLSETYTIEKGVPLLLILDSVYENNKIFFQSLKESFFELTIITDFEQFNEITPGNYTFMLSKNLVAFVPQDSIQKRHTSYQLKLTNVMNNFIYAFMRVDFNSKIFVPLPSLSGYSCQVVDAQYLRFSEFSIFETGTFDKRNVENGTYAFVFEFVDNTTNVTKGQTGNNEFYPYNIEFIVNQRKTYPIVRLNNFGYVSDKNNSFAEHLLEIEDCSDYQNQYVLFVFLKHTSKPQYIVLKNFEKNIVTLLSEKTYYVYYIKNPQLYLQIKTQSDETDKDTYTGITFSYQFVDDIDRKYVNFVESLNALKPMGVSVSKTKISWTKMNTTLPVTYHIYLFEQGKIQDALLKNEMFIASAESKKIGELKVKTETTGNSYEVTTVGNFDAVVVAQVQGPTPVRYIYVYGKVSNGGILKNLWWIILVSVLGVAGIVAGIVYFLLQKKKKEVVLPSNYDPLMGSGSVNTN